MPTMREILDTAISMERETMALYARFGKIFAHDPSLKEFWFRMARDEAGHVGALELVTTVLDSEQMLDRESPISMENETIVRLRALLDRCAREAASKVTLDRALAMSLELEETEIEDLVGDLLKASQDARDYERYLRLLVHDLGDLSYMIERHCHDPELLARCDELVNRHAEALRSSGKSSPQ